MKRNEVSISDRMKKDGGREMASRRTKEVRKLIKITRHRETIERRNEKLIT